MGCSGSRANVDGHAPRTMWWVPIRPTRQGPPLRLRVVALRKSPAAAAASRRQARQTARRHGHTVSAATWEAADYVLIVTP